MTKIIPFYKYIKVVFKRHNIVKVSPLQVCICILHLFHFSKCLHILLLCFIFTMNPDVERPCYFHFENKEMKHWEANWLVDHNKPVMSQLESMSFNLFHRGIFPIHKYYLIARFKPIIGLSCFGFPVHWFCIIFSQPFNLFFFSFNLFLFSIINSCTYF